MELKTRHLNFAIKQVSDEGTFEGLAAVYGVKDDGGDIIEPGAFTRTLQHRKHKVPLLWNHSMNEVVGDAELEDSDVGLIVRGHLDLNIARAREVHSLLKKKVIDGLSIGYDAVKSVWQGATRLLKECRLWEISITPFPMQPLATVATVKTAAEGKPFGDYESFDACVAANQDKEDPAGYCAYLQEQITGEPPAGASKQLRIRAIAAGMRQGVAQFKALHDEEDQVQLQEALAHFEQGIAVLQALLAADPEPPSAEELSRLIGGDSVLHSLYALMHEMRADMRGRQVA